MYLTGGAYQRTDREVMLESMTFSLRRDVVRVLLGVALTDLMFRIAQVAVPLVVLAATSSAAYTGLSAGATAVPVLLSPWWARTLRHRIRSGRAIALCYLGEAVALGSIPLADLLGGLGWPVLLVAGVVLGSFEAVSAPARDTLIADVGDRVGSDGAFGLLSMREFFRRVSMVVGPAIGGLAVAHGDATGLLWAEVGAVVIAAALIVGVRSPAVSRTTRAAAIWPALRARPEVRRAWVVRGTGCALWFAFSLGLALLGVVRGQPGVIVAVGLAAYGAGALVGTPLSVGLLRRLPVLPAICVAWAVTGATWVLIAVIESVPVIAVASAASGVAVAIGNGGVTALITRTSTDDVRRALGAGYRLTPVASKHSCGALSHSRFGCRDTALTTPRNTPR